MTNLLNQHAFRRKDVCQDEEFLPIRVAVKDKLDTLIQDKTIKVGGAGSDKKTDAPSSCSKLCHCVTISLCFSQLYSISNPLKYFKRFVMPRNNDIRDLFHSINRLPGQFLVLGIIVNLP